MTVVCELPSLWNDKTICFRNHYTFIIFGLANLPDLPEIVIIVCNMITCIFIVFSLLAYKMLIIYIEYYI